MFLNVPGLRNSDHHHWQSVWERQYPEEFLRVPQDNWESPKATEWVPRLQEYVMKFALSEIVLVGHSVGCATILHWYQQYQTPIKGALLVAPSDVEHPDYPEYIQGFSPLPLVTLPFPSKLVASDNDQVVSLDRASYFAQCWGSELIVLSQAGHIEKPWTGADDLLQRFL